MARPKLKAKRGQATAKPKAKKVRRAPVKKAKRAKGRTGRPEKVLPIRGAKVGQLAAMGLTDVEIAGVLDVSKSTMHDRFRPVIKKGRAELYMSLKHRQVKLALAGNVTMLIWLGKQYLKQSDRQSVIADDPGGLDMRQAKDRVAKIMADDDARKLYNKLCDRLNAMDDKGPALVRGGAGGGNGNGEDTED